jgi:serine/threonine-protein kinase HipA
MGRRPAYVPMRVYLTNRHVGVLLREAGGAIRFTYDADWLAWQRALPVSLSMPLRETAHRGEVVAAVYENLLPDSDHLRRLVAEKVGTRH